jgi:hypothetical protein
MKFLKRENNVFNEMSYIGFCQELFVHCRNGMIVN